ncbi:pilus assembly protein FlpE [Cellulosimicrobium terreum]|nr:pilus assembly protein FlpE [Cellulosimicrobium terreum]
MAGRPVGGTAGAVVGVTGARGGAGASVVAASVARGAVRRVGPGGPVCLVDLTGSGGGLDVLLGLESVPGVRWPDLHDARGRLDGEDLAARLPHWSGVAVVSGSGAHGPAGAVGPDGSAGAAGDAVLDVVAALADSCTARGGLLVLDLPRAGLVVGAPGHALLDACTELLVVTPLDVPAVAGAVGVRERVGGVPAALVVRGPAPGGLSGAEVADAVGLEVATRVGRDRGVALGIERGLGPCAGPGPLVRAGRRLAARYLAPGGDA